MNLLRRWNKKGGPREMPKAVISHPGSLVAASQPMVRRQSACRFVCRRVQVPLQPIGSREVFITELKSLTVLRMAVSSWLTGRALVIVGACGLSGFFWIYADASVTMAARTSRSIH